MQKKISPIVLTALVLAGCANFKERAVDLPKVVWGNSTRALEEARSNAISRTFSCSLDDCFSAVLALGDSWQQPVEEPVERPNTVLTGLPVNEGYTDEEDGLPVEKSPIGEEETLTGIVPPRKTPFRIFFHDRNKEHIVVIGVPGSVDSTEVGIFFDKVEGGTKIDITSLSSNAKRSVARDLFKELDPQYGDKR